MQPNFLLDRNFVDLIKEDGFIGAGHLFHSDPDATPPRVPYPAENLSIFYDKNLLSGRSAVQVLRGASGESDGQGRTPQRSPPAGKPRTVNTPARETRETRVTLASKMGEGGFAGIAGFADATVPANHQPEFAMSPP